MHPGPVRMSQAGAVLGQTGMHAGWHTPDTGSPDAWSVPWPAGWLNVLDGMSVACLL